MCDEVEYQSYLDQTKVRQACAANGLALVAYGPLARSKIKNDQTLMRIGRTYRKSAMQVCLRWLVRPNTSAIPRTSRNEYRYLRFRAFRRRDGPDRRSGDAQGPADRLRVRAEMGLRPFRVRLCWRAGAAFDHRSVAMEVRHYIRPDVTVSALVHLLLVALVLIYTEVRPFRAVAEKVVPVDIVVADEAKNPDPVPTPEPPPDSSQLTNPLTPAASSGASPPPITAPSDRRETSVQPPPQAGADAPAAAPAAPGYTPPEPDLTVKYHVILGLPEAPLAAAESGDKAGEGGDVTPAISNLASSLVEPLRRHLKSCSKLPPALSPSDNVAVKLRVQMTPDGRLAGEPGLLEGSASMKGVELMRSAIAALAACQPYSMLPADRYGEWKVLDLSFTPHDFSS